MQQRLIETRLEFVGNYQYAIRVLFKRLGGVRFRETIHIRLGIVDSAIAHSSREGDQRFVWIAFLSQIPIHCLFVAYGMQARTCHNHRFGFAIDQVSYLPGKMLDYDSHLFGDSLLMPVYKGFEQQGGFGAVIMGVALNLFKQAPVGFIGGIVLQHIEDEMLFDLLPHRVEAECFILAIVAPVTKEFESLAFRCSSAGEVANVGQSPSLLHLLGNAVLKILPLVAFFYLGIVQAANRQY